VISDARWADGRAETPAAAVITSGGGRDITHQIMPEA
jgi:hypothetical protein